MLPSGKQLKVAGVVILLLAAFFYAPIVPYGLSVDISGARGAPLPRLVARQARPIPQLV